MLSAVLLGLALAAGAPWPALGVALLAMWRPVWLLAGAALWAVVSRRRSRRRRAGPDDEAGFLLALASELDAGAALRAAVVAAAERAPALDLNRACRLAEAGLPAAAVGEALQAALPVSGRLAASAFRLASATGGRVAALFHALAARAADLGRLHRDRRALSAQARASAWVVGGMPAALLGVLAVSGRLRLLIARPAGLAVLAVGVVLEVCGVAVVVGMVRRAEP